MKLKLLICLVVLLTGLVAALPAAEPAAAFHVFNVNTGLDRVDAVLNGICATAEGQCSLRAAIQESNNVVAHGSNFIFLPAGFYPLSINGSGEEHAGYQ